MYPSTDSGCCWSAKNCSCRSMPSPSSGKHRLARCCTSSSHPRIICTGQTSTSTCPSSPFAIPSGSHCRHERADESSGLAKAGCLHSLAVGENETPDPAHASILDALGEAKPVHPRPNLIQQLGMLAVRDAYQRSCMVRGFHGVLSADQERLQD